MGEDREKERRWKKVNDEKEGENEGKGMEIGRARRRKCGRRRRRELRRRRRRRERRRRRKRRGEETIKYNE